MQHDFCQLCQQIEAEPHLWQALLHLCHHKGLQPDILLFCIWFAQGRQGTLTTGLLLSKLKASHAWLSCLLHSQAFTETLKKSNIIDRTECNAFLKQVQAAYRISLTQCEMRSMLSNKSYKHRLRDACQNIFLYCRNARVTFNRDQLPCLSDILIHIWPDCQIDITNDILTHKWQTSDQRHLNQMRLDLALSAPTPAHHKPEA